MKLIQKTLLAVAALAIAALPALAAQPKLIFGSDCTYPPMEMLDAKKEIVGFDIDMIKAVAQAAGFEAVIKNTAWDGIFAGLGSGDYDAVLSAVTITEERRATMDFSVPYVNAGQVLMVNRNLRGLTTLAQFSGRKVGAQIGTTGAIELAKHRTLDMKSYDEAGLAVEDLAAGRIDAVVIDAPTAASYVLQNEKYKARLMIVGAPFTIEHYGIAVKKGNTRVLDLINKGLKVVLKDGTVDRLTAKWLK